MNQVFKSTWPYLVTGLLAAAVLITSQSWAGDDPPATVPQDPNDAAEAEVDVSVDIVKDVFKSVADDVAFEAQEDGVDEEAAEAMEEDLAPPDEALPADNLFLLDPGQVKKTWLGKARKPSELEQRSRSLVQKARAARNDTAQYEKLKSELTEVVHSEFEALESKRRQQVETLEARLNELREVLKQRETHADQIVDRRVKTLLGESDALDWNPGSEQLGEPFKAMRFFQDQNWGERFQAFPDFGATNEGATRQQAELLKHNLQLMSQTREAARQEMEELDKQYTGKSTEKVNTELLRARARLEAIEKKAEELQRQSEALSQTQGKTRYRQDKERRDSTDEQSRNKQDSELKRAK